MYLPIHNVPTIQKKKKNDLPCTKIGENLIKAIDSRESFQKRFVTCLTVFATPTDVRTLRIYNYGPYIPGGPSVVLNVERTMFLMKKLSLNEFAIIIPTATMVYTCICPSDYRLKFSPFTGGWPRSHAFQNLDVLAGRKFGD